MWKKILKWLESSLFPVYCAGCGAEGEWFCKDCRKHYEIKPYIFYPEASLNERSVFVFFVYKDGFCYSRLLQNWKYKYARALEPLWQEMLNKHMLILAQWLRVFDRSIPLGILPVPLHKRRLRERGFNQSEILAGFVRETLLALGYNPVMIANISREKYTRQQAKFSREKRIKNMHGAFADIGGFSADVKQAIIVDDVYTTGSTMNECALALKNLGVEKICGLVLAKGQSLPNISHGVAVN